MTEEICRAMAEYLAGRGVPARTAWPAEARTEQKGPVTVVSLRGCRTEQAGLHNYLGERYDPARDLWQERYGRRAVVTLGLDLYGAEKGTEAAVQAAFDSLAEALLLGGPEGLEVQEFSCGQTAYDPGSRRLKRPAEVRCLTYLCAAGQPGGAFSDFELRGVAKV